MVQRNKNSLLLIGVLVVLFIAGIYLWLRGTTVEPSPDNSPTSTPVVTTKAPYARGQILVKFKSDVSAERITKRLGELHASIKSTIIGIGTSVISVPPGKEEEIIQILSHDELVEYAEPDYIQSINMTPNDPSFGLQWGLLNTEQKVDNKKGITTADIDVDKAWDVSTGEGVKVAVIDSGVDTAHPDLAGKIVLQKVFATSSIDDKLGHGTHVAGTIAGVVNNSQGIAGVCPGCQLIIGKALDDDGNGQTGTIAQAITWAVDNGAQVVNLSEGGAQNSQTQASAITYAQGKGAVVVGAAGNSGSQSLFYPAAISSVLSVAATTNLDQKASFSNYGSWVDVASPGQAIYSTLPTHAYNMQQEFPSLKLNYGYLSGTSMATPIVSGIAALVWTTPFGTSQTAVIDRITSTADKIAGTGQYWQYGRVNAAKAVGYTGVTPTATVPPTATTAPTSAATPVPTGVTVIPTTGVTEEPTEVPLPTTSPTLWVNPTFVCVDSGTCLSAGPTEEPSITGDPDFLTPEPTVPGQLPDDRELPRHPGLLGLLFALLWFLFQLFR